MGCCATFVAPARARTAREPSGTNLPAAAERARNSLQEIGGNAGLGAAPCDFSADVDFSAFCLRFAQVELVSAQVRRCGRRRLCRLRSAAPSRTITPILQLRTGCAGASRNSPILAKPAGAMVRRSGIGSCPRMILHRRFPSPGPSLLPIMPLSGILSVCCC